MRAQYLLFIILFTASNCTISEEKPGSNPDKRNLTQEFKDYWYDGTAEISVYDLSQSRYGEQREGHATMIFVTEDFSESKDVKLDNQSKTPDDVVKVLKLNATRKFVTGIYPYSIMSSVFTDVSSSEAKSLEKITFSSQDWCGQSWIQVNQKDHKNHLQSFSYFESEGDQDRTLDYDITEDALWNYLRYSPQLLPSGNHEIIPSMTYLRFSHNKIKSYSASCSLELTDSLSTYTIEYPEINREVQITFGNDFPYLINSWTEIITENGQEYVTKAELRERIKLDYWNKNGVADSVERNILGF